MQTYIDNGTSKLIFIPNIIDDIENNDIKTIEIINKFDANKIDPYLIYHPEINIYGKVAYQHRSVGFFTDDNKVKGYRYSGQIMKSQRLSNIMKNIINKVNLLLKTKFNAILLNYYANGNEYISAHSDSATGLKNNIIASISIGKDRTFRIRNKKTKDIVIDIQTYENGIIIMSGNFQEEFTHEIPIEKEIIEPRWSLTFREHYY